MRKLLLFLPIFFCCVCTARVSDSLVALDRCLNLLTKDSGLQSFENFWNDKVKSFAPKKFQWKFDYFKKNYAALPEEKKVFFKFGIASLAFLHGFVGESGIYEKLDDCEYLESIDDTILYTYYNEKSYIEGNRESQNNLKMYLLFDAIKAEIKSTLLSLYRILPQLTDENLIKKVCKCILGLEEFEQESLKDYSDPLVVSEKEKALLEIVPLIDIPKYDSGKYRGIPDFSKVTIAFVYDSFKNLLGISSKLSQKQKQFINELSEELGELKEIFEESKKIVKQNKSKIKPFVRQKVTKEAIENIKMTPPVLTNISGLTCYFDTAVQLLLNIKPLMKMLLGKNKEVYKKGLLLGTKDETKLTPWIDFFETVFAYPTEKNIPILPVRKAYEDLVKALNVKCLGLPSTVIKKFLSDIGVFAGSWRKFFDETKTVGNVRSRYFYLGDGFRDGILCIYRENLSEHFPEYKQEPLTFNYAVKEGFSRTFELIGMGVVRAAIPDEEDVNHVFPVIKSQYMPGKSWYFCDAELPQNIKIGKNPSNFWVNDLREKFDGAVPAFTDIAFYKQV